MLKAVVDTIPDGFEIEFRSVDAKGYWRHASFAEVYWSRDELVELLGKLRQAVAETKFDGNDPVAVVA